MINCKNCNKEFKPYRKFHLFCKNNCKQKYYNDLKRINLCLCGCRQKSTNKYVPGHKSRIINNATLDHVKQKLRGINHHNWGNGTVIRKGYRYFYMPLHPNKTKLGYILEHRYIMELKLNRFLKKEEIIHHIDGNKLNNDINNLQLMTLKQHSKFHYKLKRGGNK